MHFLTCSFMMTFVDDFENQNNIFLDLNTVQVYTNVSIKTHIPYIDELMMKVFYHFNDHRLGLHSIYTNLIVMFQKTTLVLNSFFFSGESNLILSRLIFFILYIEIYQLSIGKKTKLWKWKNDHFLNDPSDISI